MPNSRVPIQSMTREDWLRVKTITAAALEQPEARRPRFVTDACAGDQPLEQEVRSLLSSAVSASALFEAPVFAAASAINRCVRCGARRGANAAKAAAENLKKA